MVANVTVKCLEGFGLKLSNMVTDGASVMTVRKTGVGVQLKSKYSQFSTQTHCIAHRLNLAVSDSIKKNEVLKKLKDKFDNLYHFISGSSIRTTRLQKLQEILNEPDLTIKEPHSIRWLGLKNAVLAVYESYGLLLATLSSFAAEGKPQAKGMFKYFCQYKTVTFVSLLLDVHEVLAKLSSELQKRNLVFCEYQPLIDVTYAQLEHLETNDGSALSAMKNCIEIKTKEGQDYAYLAGQKLTHYGENIQVQLNNATNEYLTNLKKTWSIDFERKKEKW